MFKALILTPAAMRSAILPLLAALLVSAAPAQAGPGDAQGQLRKERREGKVLSSREIEREVLPAMRGAQYLGPEYDPVAMAYRLKFIRDGRVMFIDVDARTGAIIRRSQ